MEWIDCEKALPEKGVETLVMRTSGRIAVMSQQDFDTIHVFERGRKSVNRAWSFEGTEQDPGSVTHWMELPKGPRLIP